MTLLLILLYPLGIQYQRGGLWLLVAPIAYLALFVDIVANYTELALLTLDFPQAGEETFSKRCRRLITQDGWAGFVGRITQKYTNFFMANHI